MITITERLFYNNDKTGLVYENDPQASKIIYAFPGQTMTEKKAKEMGINEEGKLNDT